MHKSIVLILIINLLSSCTTKVELPVEASKTDMVFPSLAKTWDEGVPLGNGTVGALVWQRDSMLRFSLDRVDLWDLRPVDSISGPNNRFTWVYEQVKKGDYLPVQKKYDHPYDQMPAPSKIPGAALEFGMKDWGKPTEVHLYLNNALCETKWENGVTLKTFVHAEQPVGWFVFDNLQDSLDISLVAPQYQKKGQGGEDGPVVGLDLRRLGYEQGKITRSGNTITYHQPGWNGFYYDVHVKWEKKGSQVCGVWTITSSLSEENAEQYIADAFRKDGLKNDYKSHQRFWNNFWDASSVTVPDPILQKQYNQEMYRLGSIAREDSYPISLQAVWTADNGKLPPWKGDFHHDLNTQLSYWPVYTGNHLTEGLGYLNTLWNQRDVYKKYTKTYFECEGMNIPGVCTLTGEPMGGWIQYSMSPTVGAWLSHHFYLHWKYTGDETFLKERAYPFMRDIVVFLEQISSVNKDGVRTLPISSSPEIFDNSINAWFRTMTNYDLALMRFAFSAASEMAEALNLKDEAAHWSLLEKQMPAFDVDEENTLTFAKGFPYKESHRHFSHAMAIHPLGLIDYSQGEDAQKIINATLDRMEKVGPDWWCGYSYSWFANMKARAFDGEGAAKALRTFAECFCLSNGFHANGDQTKSGKSKFTYRPFTLEGNMAFAAGLQEMLLQSHTGIIRVFPAIPDDWKDVAFEDLRAMGGFQVSAEKEDGKLKQIKIAADHDSVLRLANTFGENYKLSYSGGDVSAKDGVWEVRLKAGECAVVAD